MFFQSAGRAARSVSSNNPSVLLQCSRTTCSAATATATQPRSTVAVHSRRHSSSKASYPPGRGRGSEHATNDSSAASPAEDEKKPSSTRVVRRKSKDTTSEEKSAKARDAVFANIPAVPSTKHLQVGDVHVSSFFSLHRPISVTQSVPPLEDTNSKFEAIFAPKSPYKPHDVIYTLSNAASALESQSQPQEEKDLRFEIMQQSHSNSNQNGIIYLDKPPQPQSFEEMVKQFRPFNVPPPPVPFDENATQNTKADEKVQNDSSDETQHAQTGLEPQDTHKTYTTTLTINERTSPSGQKSYNASASPIIEEEFQSNDAEESQEHTLPHQPFLSRLWEKQRRYDQRRLSTRMTTDRAAREMWMISVKRQRKLKMKKHKLKKLMRRTRTIRRREGRT